MKNPSFSQFLFCHFRAFSQLFQQKSPISVLFSTFISLIPSLFSTFLIISNVLKIYGLKIL